MTSIEISARAKLLSVATAIAEQYGEQESDWEMLYIWRAFEYGELNDCLSGILRIDAQKAAQAVHEAPYGRKVDALIDCASKALERSKAQPEASAARTVVATSSKREADTYKRRRRKKWKKSTESSQRNK